MFGHPTSSCAFTVSPSCLRFEFFVFFPQQVVTKRAGYVLPLTAQEEGTETGATFFFPVRRLTGTRLLKWMSQMCNEGWVAFEARFGLCEWKLMSSRLPVPYGPSQEEAGRCAERLSLCKLQSRKQNAQRELDEGKKTKQQQQGDNNYEAKKQQTWTQWHCGGCSSDLLIITSLSATNKYL